jgi:hypothetical protein
VLPSGSRLWFPGICIPAGPLRGPLQGVSAPIGAAYWDLVFWPAKYFWSGRPKKAGFPRRIRPATSTRTGDRELTSRCSGDCQRRRRFNLASSSEWHGKATGNPSSLYCDSLPEVRGRACAGAASASYASCRSDSIYILLAPLDIRRKSTCRS